MLLTLEQYSKFGKSQIDSVSLISSFVSGTVFTNLVFVDDVIALNFTRVAVLLQVFLAPTTPPPSVIFVPWITSQLYVFLQNG